MFIPYRFPSTWDDTFFSMSTGHFTVPLWISVALVIASMTFYELHKRTSPERAKHHLAYIRTPIIAFLVIYALQPILFSAGYAAGFGRLLGHLIFSFVYVIFFAAVPLGIYWLAMKLSKKSRKNFFFAILVILSFSLPAHIGFVYYKMTYKKCCPPGHYEMPFGSYVGPPQPSALHALFGLPQPGHQPPVCRKCEASEALALLLKLAEEGNAKAQAHLGYGYERGSFVAQDKFMAVQWYLKAAEQGNVGAISNLAKFYFSGPEELKNYVEAAKWYKRELESVPNAQAYDKLARIYAEGGYGVTPDYEEAYFFYLQAEHFHLKDEVRKEKILKNISDEKKESIQIKSMKWLGKHHKGN